MLRVLYLITRKEAPGATPTPPRAFWERKSPPKPGDKSLQGIGPHFLNHLLCHIS